MTGASRYLLLPTHMSLLETDTPTETCLALPFALIPWSPKFHNESTKVQFSKKPLSMRLQVQTPVVHQNKTKQKNSSHIMAPTAIHAQLPEAFHFSSSPRLMRQHLVCLQRSGLAYLSGSGKDWKCHQTSGESCWKLIKGPRKVEAHLWHNQALPPP